MPQMELPLFPEDVTEINFKVAYAKRDGRIWYFNGQMPLFFHDEKDEDSFRMFMAQLHVMGVATQSEINRAFGFNPINMKRWVKKYREQGPSGFFNKKRKRNPRVLVKEVLENAQTLLSEGLSPSEIGEKLDIKPDTIRKAIQKGKLIRPVEKKMKK